MSESNKEENSHLGAKIESMLEEFVKCDDDMENNPIRNSLNLSDDNSSLDEEKEYKEEGLFDKEFFNNIFPPPNEEQNQQNKKNPSVN